MHIYEANEKIRPFTSLLQLYTKGTKNVPRMSMQSLSPPVVIYPKVVRRQPSSHSKGSFGPVFAVLGVVIVLSAIACLISQLCARRCSRSRQANRHTHIKQPKREFHPKPSFRESHLKQPRRDHNLTDEIGGDIEYGFQPRMPSGKPGGKGENSRVLKPAEYGETKGETKAAQEATNAY